MKFASKITLALAAVASVAGFASVASANEGHWGRHHEYAREVQQRDHERGYFHRDGQSFRGSDHGFARRDHRDGRF